MKHRFNKCHPADLARRWLASTVGLTVLGLSPHAATWAQGCTTVGSSPPRTGQAPSANPMQPPVPNRATKINLSGQIMGTSAWRPAVPDDAGTFGLRGSGAVEPLGLVQAHGDLQRRRLGARGRMTGNLRLSTVQGSLILTLTGPAQHGASSGPMRLRFSVTGGTGHYQGKSGSGDIQLTMKPGQPPAVVPAQPAPQRIAAPNFIMRLQSGG